MWADEVSMKEYFSGRSAGKYVRFFPVFDGSKNRGVALTPADDERYQQLSGEQKKQLGLSLNRNEVDFMPPAKWVNDFLKMHGK